MNDMEITGAAAVFAAFFRLGLTAFGGPVAHLGYFRTAFVARRKWLDEAEFADLLALCQFLPGPTSSQLGFAIGLKRAGIAGGLAAFAGFTLPSLLLLIGFALAAGSVGGPVWDGVLRGLKLVAVAVVAQAVVGMARSLCADWPRRVIALLALAIALAAHGFAGQLAAIALGLLAGTRLRVDSLAAQSSPPRRPDRKSDRRAALCLLAFAVLFLPGLIAGSGAPTAFAVFDAAYRAGALVFGGGHVVLPLLKDAFVPALLSEGTFLAGYGAAQAVPGPLFTIAAFLGAASGGPGLAIVATAAIFLPGFLLLGAALPSWDRLKHRRGMRAALAGVNAAVVGLLAAALYDPIWTGAVFSALDAILAVAGALALMRWQWPPLLLVAVLAAGGALRGLLAV